MLISYAQNFEDVILWRALRHVEMGCYVDVGAHDPIIDSVSLAFYERGWRGIHVEPTPEYASRLRAARPDEEVIEAAVGLGGDALRFHVISDTGLSTGDPDVLQRHLEAGFQAREVTVPLVGLGDVLDRRRAREIHWLKIDVEGMERAAIESWGSSPVRPWILVVESNVPGSTEPAFQDWEPLLLDRGYEFVYFDGLNRFYVSTAHPELKTAFGPGPNVFDCFVLSTAARAAAQVRELESQVAVMCSERAALETSLEAAQSAREELEARLAARPATLMAGDASLAGDAQDGLANAPAAGSASSTHGFTALAPILTALRSFERIVRQTTVVRRLKAVLRERFSSRGILRPKSDRRNVLAREGGPIVTPPSTSNAPSAVADEPPSVRASFDALARLRKTATGAGNFRGL